MKNRIVEKRFVTRNSQVQNYSRPFKQVAAAQKSFQEVSSIYENAEQHNTLYSQFKDRSQTFQRHNNSAQILQKQSNSELLSYSQTQIVFCEQQLFPLLKKLISLFVSRQNISNHIANSLKVKGYRQNTTIQISKIVTNTFGQYITLANNIAAKIKEYQDKNIDEKYMRLNRAIANLKMENARQFEQITRLSQENVYFKKKIQQKVRQNDYSIVQIANKNQLKEIRQYIYHQKTKFDLLLEDLQTKIYKKLGKYQDTLIQLSYFRNNLMLDKNYVNSDIFVSQQTKECQTEHENHKERDEQIYLVSCNQQLLNNHIYIIKEKQAQINRLGELILATSDQLDLQKKLYDQMIEKNIALEKEIYFLSNQNQPFEEISSFKMKPDAQNNNRTQHSPSFQDSFDQ